RAARRHPLLARPRPPRRPGRLHQRRAPGPAGRGPAGGRRRRLPARPAARRRPRRRPPGAPRGREPGGRLARRAHRGAAPARQAGAGRAYLLDEPLAAAIGADLPVHDAVASMVVDCGGGNTEAAVVSLGGVVTSQTVRVGGYDLDVALQDWVRTAHGIAIGDRTAEELKIAIGSAFPQPTAEHAEVRGRDLESGTTRTVTVEADEVRTAIERPVTAIVGTVLDAL